MPYSTLHTVYIFGDFNKICTYKNCKVRSFERPTLRTSTNYLALEKTKLKRNGTYTIHQPAMARIDKKHKHLITQLYAKTCESIRIKHKCRIKSKMVAGFPPSGQGHWRRLGVAIVNYSDLHPIVTPSVVGYMAYKGCGTSIMLWFGKVYICV